MDWQITMGVVFSPRSMTVGPKSVGVGEFSGKSCNARRGLGSQQCRRDDKRDDVGVAEWKYRQWF